MITSAKILVKREKSRGHEETVLHVNWDLCSDEDVKLLASFYVQECAIRQLKLNDGKLDDSVTVMANEYLHREVIVEKPVNVPDSWRSGTDKVRKVRKMPSLHELLKGLSDEELKNLLSEG